MEIAIFTVNFQSVSIQSNVSRKPVSNLQKGGNFSLFKILSVNLKSNTRENDNTGIFFIDSAWQFSFFLTLSLVLPGSQRSK